MEATEISRSGEFERLLADIGYSTIETSTLELKENVPSAKELARLMSGFANTDGGIIIIGVTDNFRIVGVPEGAPLENLYQEACSSLRPRPLMNYRFADIAGKQIFIITIQKYPGPILTKDERYYIRKEGHTTLLDEILIEELVRDVPSIKTNILNSIGINEQEAQKAENTNKFTEIVHKKLDEVDLNKFHEDLLREMDDKKGQLASRRKERIQQTNITYYVSLVCLILGVLLVFTGVILIFIGKLPGAVLTIITGGISSIVSGVIFVFNKVANERENEDLKETKALEKSYDAMGYISCIGDPKMRDELTSNLVKKLFLES